MNTEASTSPIDRLMERASQALAETEYHRGAVLCREALSKARAADDFGRMARICLPFQEARRQIRQSALDEGPVLIVGSKKDLPKTWATGCVLVQPPMVGVDARQLRTAAWNADADVTVLCREPMTRDGLWPIVGVGERVARVRIEPPGCVEPIDGANRPMTGDRITGSIPVEWFAEAGEALGDRAIVEAQAAAQPDDPAAWIVDDFLDFLDACPDHEKFVQALAEACRDAMGTTTPTDRRRRRGQDDPTSF